MIWIFTPFSFSACSLQLYEYRTGTHGQTNWVSEDIPLIAHINQISGHQESMFLRFLTLCRIWESFDVSEKNVFTPQPSRTGGASVSHYQSSQYLICRFYWWRGEEPKRTSERLGVKQIRCLYAQPHERAHRRNIRTSNIIRCTSWRSYRLLYCLTSSWLILQPLLFPK
jgi:hypothetical protein